MIVAAVRLSLLIPEATSLKEKRQALRSLKDRIRHNFNVSVAEVGQLDSWRRAELLVAAAGNDQQVLNAKMDKLINFVEGTGLAAEVGAEVEFIHLGGAWRDDHHLARRF